MNLMNAPSKTFISIPGLNNSEKASHKNELRLPFLGFLPNKPRNHFIAMVGEFIGTFLFLFFAFSATQVANAAAAGVTTEEGSLTQVPNAGVILYISLAFGFSLAVNAWVFFRISGGLFNPAVTLGMALIGAVSWFRAALIFIAQILGSIAAAGVVAGLLPGPLSVSTSLSAGTSVARGLFLEMFLTTELVFTIFMLAAEKHKGTFIAPIGIGLALFVAELSGVFFTGGSLNPARSFGPAVVLGTFPGSHWIYWVGPALGSLMAVGFYRFVKLLEYETANPGQDFNEHEAEVFEFDEENAATGADVIRPNPVLPSNSNLMLSRSQSQQVGGMSLVGNRTSTFGAGSMYGAGNNRDSMYGGNRTLAGSPDRPVSGGGTTSGTTHPMNPLGPVDGSNEKLPFDEGGRMESGRPTYSKNDDKGSASTG